MFCFLRICRFLVSESLMHRFFWDSLMHI
jgi:hypothetical protein